MGNSGNELTQNLLCVFNSAAFDLHELRERDAVHPLEHLHDTLRVKYLK